MRADSQPSPVSGRRQRPGPVCRGIVIPALMVSGLALWPYLDRNPSRLARQRTFSIILFSLLVLVTIVLTITGTYFRGPEWSFVTPW